MEIQIRMAAPARERALKKASLKPREARMSRLITATRDSVIRAMKIILRLLGYPDCSTSVNTAVITGPGIKPPIRPSIHATTSSWIIKEDYAYNSMGFSCLRKYIKQCDFVY
jgi:hypothetical protein